MDYQNFITFMMGYELKMESFVLGKMQLKKEMESLEDASPPAGIA